MVVAVQAAALALRILFARCRMACVQALAAAAGNSGEYGLPGHSGSSVVAPSFAASRSAGPDPLVRHFWPAILAFGAAVLPTYPNELLKKTWPHLLSQLAAPLLPENLVFAIVPKF